MRNAHPSLAETAHVSRASRLLAFLATIALLALAGALTPALAAEAGPTITINGANAGPRQGPDGAVLYECPLTVTYSGGAPGASVSVDVMTVAPTAPSGKSVLVGGARAVNLSGSGAAAIVSSPTDLDFTGVTPFGKDTDLFKIQVLVKEGNGVTASNFWVADCVPVTPSPTTTTTTATTVALVTSPSSPTSAATTSTTTKIATVVLGQTITRPPAATRSTLPVTGANTFALLMLTGLLLVAGSAITVFAKLGRGHGDS